MTHIININAEAKHGKASETQPCNHNRITATESSATTVVILKTSSHDSLPTKMMNSNLITSVVVLDNSISLSTGSIETGLKSSLAVQASRGQQNVCWSKWVGADKRQSNNAAYVDNEHQLLSGPTIKGFNTLDPGNVTIESSPVKNNNFCKSASVSIADRRIECKSVIPVERNKQTVYSSSLKPDYPVMKEECSKPGSSSLVKCKFGTIDYDRDKSKFSISGNPFSFTTACAPDALRFRFQCQSCLTVRFAVYWDLRLHEDWCGRCFPSSVGLSCQECGNRYKNLVLLHRHLVEVHCPNSTRKSAMPYAHNAASDSNPYSFTTVCARDAADFPYVCTSCKTVCFKQSDYLRRHEDWCGRSGNECRTFMCQKCGVAFRSDVLLQRHRIACIDKVSSTGGCCASTPTDDFTPNNLRTVHRDVCVGNIDVCSKPDSFLQEKLSSSTVTFRARSDSKCSFTHDSPSKQSQQSVSNSFCCLDCSVSFKTRLMLTKHQCSKVDHPSASGISSWYQDSKSLNTCVDKSSKHEPFNLATRLSADSMHRRNKLFSIEQSKSVGCLKCRKLFGTRLHLMQHKRSSCCSTNTSLGDTPMSLRSQMRQIAIRRVAYDKDSESTSDEYFEPWIKVDHSTKNRQKHELFRNDLSLVNATVVEYAESKTCSSERKCSTDDEKCCSDIIETAVVMHELPFVEESTSPTNRSLNSSVAANDDVGSFASNVTGQDRRLNSEPNCKGSISPCALENEPLKRNTTRLAASEYSLIKPIKIQAVSTDLVDSACNTELHTEKFNSVVVKSEIVLEQATMLRALDLIPLEERSSTKIPSSIVDASRRKRKCRSTIAKFDPSDFQMYPRKTSTRNDSAVGNRRRSVEPVAVRSIKDNQLKSKNTKCVVKDAKKTGKAKEANTSKTKKSGINRRRQHSKSSVEIQSKRILEPVGDNALRCVTCYVLLRTIRQIIAHVCR